MNKKLSRLLEPGMKLYFFIMLLFSVAAAIFSLYYLALFEAVVTILLYYYFRMTKLRRRREIISYIESVSLNKDSSSSLLNFPLPIVVIRPETNEILWNNDKFLEIGKNNDLFETKLSDIVPDFNSRWLMEGKVEYPFPVEIGDKRYSIYGSLIRNGTGRSGLAAYIYWVEQTKLLNTYDEYHRSRPVIAVLLLDNYDEITKNMTDSAKTGILAVIDEKINAWAESSHGLLLKTERDRYLFVFEQRHLQIMIDNKFSILDSVRAVVNHAGQAATLSIGIGKDGASFVENYQYSALGLEMCLSRGGDQAVVKDRYNFTFFGGRSKETERRTKVKSRVIANSLGELVSESSHIFVMGHKNSDIDSVGAAAGIVCLARKKSIEVHIVIDLKTSAAANLISRLDGLHEYEDIFITPQEALLLADSRSLLIVVDTNRPDQVESREFLLSCNHIAVIDHHRRAADYIENVTLSFHEPFASSACELVTELLQYLVDQSDILKTEAEALLAGIVLDTKNFSLRTTSRTFEAAAYLRRVGADTVSVKKLFQNDLSSTIARYGIIQNARLFRDEIAIAAIDSDTDHIIAAQAADELLNVEGITTSFVVFPSDDKIAISARSIGDANVQVILEKLGGGGNSATAGAQISGKSLNQVLSSLVASINSFYDRE